MAADPSTVGAGGGETGHGRRFVVTWLVISAIATPLVAIFLGPHLPPGNMSEQSAQQVVDNTVMTSIVTPVVVFVLVFFAYALVSFRHAKGAALVDGPPVRENNGIQVAWILLTSVTVLFLAGFGTYELLQNGAGGGQGPSPVAVPGGPKLQVQVIGQQWEFTYRYPTFGGMESHELVLPENTYVELHVTSLDVIHSFWAYQLGVKADANPGVDNVAYVKTRGSGTFEVRCAELCGLFHGYMFNTGRVVTDAQFQTWAKQQRAVYQPIAQYMPAYATTYLCPGLNPSASCSPQPALRGG